MKKVDSLLRPLVRDFGMESDIKFIELKKNWHILFNGLLVCHMSPYRLTEGVILLNVDSPVWLQELKYFKRDIVGKLSLYGVKDVRFKLGRVSMKDGAETRDEGTGAKTFTHEELLYIEKTISRIADKELRGTVRRAIEKSISSRKTEAKL